MISLQAFAIIIHTVAQQNTDNCERHNYLLSISHWVQLKLDLYLKILPTHVHLSIKFEEKVYFKSQILVHKYWTILDHFGILVLFAFGCHQHVLKNVNITFPDNTGRHKMFQYLPILGHSSIWDLKYTFSKFALGLISFSVFLSTTVLGFRILSWARCFNPIASLNQSEKVGSCFG